MKQQFGGDIYINLAITIQPLLLEVCQEIALKSHWEKAERMDHGQFVTRHTFSRKKGQQLCGSVKWKQPARTDVRASGRLHVGKGFLETLDEIVKIIQNAVASTGFPRLWQNLPDWVTGMILDNNFWHLFVLCLAKPLDPFMIIDHESVEDLLWHFKVVKCRNLKKKVPGKRIWSSSSRSDLHHVIKRSNDFHWLEFRWSSAYCLVHKLCHMNPALTGKILSCTLLCAGCMTLIHCNVTWYCVDIPIVPYVHTVPTYGREVCERKAMNRWNSNLEVIHQLGNHHTTTVTRNLPRDRP